MSGESFDNHGRGSAEWRWPPIHPQGRFPGAVVLGTGLVLLFFPPWDYLGWPLLVLGLGILAFFRDPARVVPQDDKQIIAPADGLVSLIDVVEPPKELLASEGGAAPGMAPGQYTRISIFMSVFDVHINRAPIGGTARRIAYIRGKFMNAGVDKASEENERQHFLLERQDGTQIAFTQIAGLVARRIVPFIKEGDTVAAGQRIGLIRFGSRVDVYLPAGTDPKVILGQRVIAGETVLAEIGKQLTIEGIAQ